MLLLAIDLFLGLESVWRGDYSSFDGCFLALFLLHKKRRRREEQNRTEQNRTEQEDFIGKTLLPSLLLLISIPD